VEEKKKEAIRVLDRRKFTADGERREGVDIPPPAPEPVRTEAAEPQPPPKEPLAAPPEGSTPKASRGFTLLIQQLFQTCALFLGAPDPVTGQAIVDLPAANEYIDIIEALQEKTRGNLAPQEKQLVEEALAHLKMLYVQARQKRPQ
jgi:hypothetical protein